MSSLEYPQQVFWMLLFLLGGGGVLINIIKNLNTYFPNPIATVTKKNMLQLKDNIINIIYKIKFLFREKGLSEPNAIMLTLVVFAHFQKLVLVD